MAITKIKPIPAPVFTYQIINGVNTYVGTNLNDTMYAPASPNPARSFLSVDSGAGDDTIYANNTTGTIVYGNIGNDKLIGGQVRDILHGGDGMLLGNGGNDILFGDAGNDYIDGDANIDAVYYNNATSAVTIDLAITTAQNTGGAGIDTIVNVENVVGSLLNDVLSGDANNNYIFGNSGNDTLDGRAGNDTIDGSLGDDTIYGGDDNDTITGGEGTDTIYAGAGDDIILNANDGSSNDIVDGGAGIDTLNYTTASSIVIDLSKGIATGGTAIAPFTQTLSNIENVTISNAFNNTLIGNDSDNILTNNNGNDVLIGNAGNDKLIGGYGSDQMTGGAGADTFVMQLMTNVGKDIVLDFSAAEGDKINISAVSAFLADGAAFTGVAGQVHVVADASIAGLQHIEQDYNGDMVADIFGDVYSSTTLSSGDFFFYV